MDVYRRQTPACRNLLEYMVFVSLFPQLVAGPIMRAGKMIGQVRSTRVFDPERVQSGLLLLLWGFFQKLVIADNVAVIANKVFAMQAPDFPILWTGVLAFCVQIYADFSAYTDIARGTARLLGFELIRNFNHPYLARIPGGFLETLAHLVVHMDSRLHLHSRSVAPTSARRGRLANILIVFFLTGLWHGASWNFVLWGLYNGVLILIYRLAGRVIPPPLQTFPGAKILRIAIMFVLTNIGWLIFREQSIDSLWREPDFITRQRPRFWIGRSPLTFARSSAFTRSRWSFMRLLTTFACLCPRGPLPLNASLGCCCSSACYYYAAAFRPISFTSSFEMAKSPATRMTAITIARRSVKTAFDGCSELICSRRYGPTNLLYCNLSLP